MAKRPLLIWRGRGGVAVADSRPERSGAAWRRTGVRRSSYGPCASSLSIGIIHQYQLNVARRSKRLSVAVMSSRGRQLKGNGMAVTIAGTLARRRASRLSVNECVAP